MSLNILYIAHESGCNFNGASRSLISIIRQIKEKYAVHVVIPEDGGMLKESLNDMGIEPIIVPYYRCCIQKSRSALRWKIWELDWKYRRKRINLKYIKELEMYCKEKKINLIHSNSSVVDIGNILSDRLSIPHVWHFREFGEEDFGIYPLETLEKRIQSIDRENNYIVCVSDAVRRKYETKLKKAHIFTMYNGIDVNTVCKKTEHETFNVLLTGMINGAKGQEVAIKAVKETLNKYGDIHLYLAGGGDISRLKRIVSDRIVENVHFLGQVSNMIELRASMDVELVCSKSEAFGRTTVEAMICKLPVIGSRSGGTTELINDGIDGILFKQGDYMSLASSIIWCYENRNSIQEMGNHGYEKVKERFSEERLINEIVKLYGHIEADFGFR